MSSLVVKGWQFQFIASANGSADYQMAREKHRVTFCLSPIDNGKCMLRIHEIGTTKFEPALEMVYSNSLDEVVDLVEKHLEEEEPSMRVFVQWKARDIEERCEAIYVSAHMTIQDLLQHCLKLARVESPSAHLYVGSSSKKSVHLTMYGEHRAMDFLSENTTITLEVGNFAHWLKQDDVVQSLDPWISNKPKTDVFVIENLLTAEECKKLIQVSENAGYDLIDYNSLYRSNMRVQIDNPSFASVLFERVRKFMPDMEQSGVWKPCGLNPQFRFCRYERGQDFKQHVDGVFDESTTCKSFFTLNIYLNQEFDGGSTRFFDDPQDKAKVTRSVKPQTGHALVFDHRTKSYLHDGEEVTNGTKYLLRSDVMYSCS